ncbi:MarR family winged helix-turn-helix transcriptional regulator [Halalkalibacter krulwichiae]|uniref:Putative HTH-type transcriptional regulator/GBAA_1941/BAS1801 n=1 Tax=Halalkalibacter krulwichiae TaxID=199441 RepID=A0A1X9MDR4_9BACI|nr:MarR family transcriptional regulator [Halalkalibacter krulwichiae]ARK30690.1 putative HTH-type transcriptional regulator/GBAA_1941/BAS1801 [Halalkalibacter krulwichiae]
MSVKSSKQKRLGVLLWYRLAQCYHLSNRRSNQHLKKWGLSIAQFDLLVQIGAHQPISQKDLADKLLVTKGNITQMLSKMEKSGLVEKKQEWRTKHISLTSEGRKVYAELVPKQEAYQAEQFSGLTEKEQKHLLYLLKKARRNMEGEE